VRLRPRLKTGCLELSSLAAAAAQTVAVLLEATPRGGGTGCDRRAGQASGRAARAPGKRRDRVPRPLRRALLTNRCELAVQRAVRAIVSTEAVAADAEEHLAINHDRIRVIPSAQAECLGPRHPRPGGSPQHLTCSSVSGSRRRGPRGHGRRRVGSRMEWAVAWARARAAPWASAPARSRPAPRRAG